MTERPVVVVGAGLAGLCCARELHRRGMPTLVLEASDGVGGRVRTDLHDGFLLDRGFQVLLTAYPECRAVLDYDALDLRPFFPGSLVRRGGRVHRVADPWRKPLQSLLTLFTPVGGLGDKLRVARFRAAVRGRTIEEIFAAPERTAAEALRDRGFSEEMLDRFFRPFFGGVFLERDLSTSSRMLEFLFKMFSEGNTAIPAAGMQSIPLQIAAGLPEGCLRTGARVDSVRPDRVLLEGGEEIHAASVVIATDGAEYGRLVPGEQRTRFRSTVCLYFDAPEPPVREPILVLDGDGRGPANHVCVVSEVAPGYAPEGRALVSVNVVEPASLEPTEDLERGVREQMGEWFGSAAADWRLLRAYRIPRALPSAEAGALDPPSRPVALESGLFVCGDHRENGSIQGAMASGRRAAQAISADRT